MVSFVISGGSVQVTLNSILRVVKNTDGVSGAAQGAGNIYSGCVINKRRVWEEGIYIYIYRITLVINLAIWLVHI